MTVKGAIKISGISDSRVAPVASRIIKEEKGKSLLVVSSQVRADRLATDLSFFMDRNVYVFPEEDHSFIRYDAKDRNNVIDRLKVLQQISEDPQAVVIAPIQSALRKMPPKEILLSKTLSVQIGFQFDMEDLKVSLASMGYERLSMVEGKGQFAIRGSIVDVFAVEAEDPYRIEFFDDQVDSIRSFDIGSQRSIENLDKVEIFPAVQMIRDDDLFAEALEGIRIAYDKRIKALKCGRSVIRKQICALEEQKEKLENDIRENINLQQLENYIGYFYENVQSIYDHMNEPLIMIDDPNSVTRYFEDKLQEFSDDFEVMIERGKAIPEDKKSFASEEDLLWLYERAIDTGGYIFTPFSNRTKNIDTFSKIITVESRQTPSFNGRLDILEKEVKNYISRKYKVVIVCSTDERAKNMREFLQRAKLERRVEVKTGVLTAGIDFPDECFCCIWEGDIFPDYRVRKRRKPAREKSSVVRDFSDISNGDYVVHENHGIGKFAGIRALEVDGVRRDYLKIKYAGADVLYVPVEQMDTVQKYICGEACSPRLNKLSGSDWKLTKARAKVAIEEMAHELLETSAKRREKKGYSFQPDSEWQHDFESDFKYVETQDQLDAAEDIKRDMESEFAMDRLLCGDVGFGKTEVAARGIFKCVSDGKQAVMLVPTTILANQHYHTLKERFEKSPFTVEMLSRFRSTAQQEEIIKRLKNGMIDIVIGTHRLLYKDVQFKDLGLLVIDEEQRFGVKHKENIKQLRSNVDVLTLSATPIPRTLQMSLLGIKDMSLIQEPPDERYPVQTYVMEQDENVIKDAVERELDRCGQVYVVFNRVRGIRRVAHEIKNLVPYAKVSVGHGQMDERMLERTIFDFINGDIDVLVATSIIESGIDIPNVNTMIIMDADRYGLSQLYQLRGRVGRSNRLAYAYLMYKKDKTLSDVAEKRLRAIREFTELGAGFKVAMRDLEIRGAGNIVGKEQHGHMIKIGYELYCKLVDDAVKRLDKTGDRNTCLDAAKKRADTYESSSKKKNIPLDDDEVSLEFDVAAYIPEKYISDERLKLHMYKKIASIENEYDEMEITDELIDRFGDIPRETLVLIKIARIKTLARKNNFNRLAVKRDKIRFFANEGGGPNPQGLAAAAEKFGMKIFIHGGVSPEIRYKAEGRDTLNEMIDVLQTLLV